MFFALKRFIALLQISALLFAALFGASCSNSQQAGSPRAVSDAASQEILSESDLPSSDITSDGVVLPKNSSSITPSEHKSLVSSAPAFESSSLPGGKTAGKKEYDSGIDIVAIGSSSTYRYFIPTRIYEKYGVTSQVIAGASTSGKMFKYYIEEAKKLYDPDVFVVELRWFVKKQTPPIRNDRNLKTPTETFPKSKPLLYARKRRTRC